MMQKNILASKKSSPQKIVVCGNYGATNLGDEAILDGILDLLKQAAPQAKVTVLSANPAGTMDLHGGNDGGFQLASAYQLPVGLRSFFRRLFSGDLWRTVKIIQECDFFILGGGGLFTDEKMLAILIWALQANFAALCGKPIFCLGQSVGPLRTFFGRRMTRNVYSKAEFITVRDSGSLLLLNAIGVPAAIGWSGNNLPHLKTASNLSGFVAPRSHILADPAFLTHVNEPFDREPENFIVMSVRPWKNAKHANSGANGYGKTESFLEHGASSGGGESFLEHDTSGADGSESFAKDTTGCGDKSGPQLSLNRDGGDESFLKHGASDGGSESFPEHDASDGGGESGLSSKRNAGANRDFSENLYKNLAQFISWIWQKYGFKTVLVPFQGIIDNDTEVLNRICEQVEGVDFKNAGHRNNHVASRVGVGGGKYADIISLGSSAGPINGGGERRNGSSTENARPTNRAAGHGFNLNSHAEAGDAKVIGATSLGCSAGPGLNLETETRSGATHADRGQSHICEVFEFTEDYKKVIELISRAQAVVGMRLHSLIFSTITEVPFLALSYSDKVKQLVKDLEMSDFLIDLENCQLAELKNKFDRLMAEKENVKTLLTEKNLIMRARAREHLDLLREFFKLTEHRSN